MTPKCRHLRILFPLKFVKFSFFLQHKEGIKQIMSASCVLGRVYFELRTRA